MAQQQTNQRPRQHVTFFTKSVPDKRASIDAGRPVYKDADYIRIKFAGDARDVFEANAHEPYRPGSLGQADFITYAEDYPEEFAAYKAGKAAPLHGTPLTELPFLSESQRANLKGLNILTAEDLVSLDGVNRKNLGMWGGGVIEKAKAFLEAASGTADLTRFAAENAALKEQMAKMQEQMEQILGGQASGDKPEPAPQNTPPSPFDRFDVETLKVYIADQTGSRPRGTPTRETLLAKAEEIAAKIQEEKVA